MTPVGNGAIEKAIEQGGHRHDRLAWCRAAKGSAGEIEELGRKLGLAGASPPPKAGTRREAGTATQVP